MDRTYGTQGNLLVPMILDKQDSIYVVTKLMRYFKDFNHIDDYFRARKIEELEIFLLPLNYVKVIFQDYDLHPEDMNFKL